MPQSPSLLPLAALHHPITPLPLSGDNRGQGHLTRAQDDLSAVAEWLYRYPADSHTFASYRREAERLLAWCADRGHTLSQLMGQDMNEYRGFLRDPQPRARWCVCHEAGTDAQAPARGRRKPPRQLPDGRPNPDWRPFMQGLSERTAQQAMTILSGLFEHLSAVGYLQGNPMRAIRVRRARSGPVQNDRYFDQALWTWLHEHLAQPVSNGSPRQQAHRVRDRFVLGFLYLTGLRRFELAQARTTHLQAGPGGWWLSVDGKGGSTQSIPLSDEAVRLIRDYREHNGRPPWPTPDIDEPLIMDVTGQGRALGPKAIHQIVKSCLLSAAQACPDPHQAERLRSASAHWLRHTAATHQIEAGIPLLVVRDNLRHASVQTTERHYIHQNRVRQHGLNKRHTLSAQAHDGTGRHADSTDPDRPI